ncbi:septal ring lytic transglycosylase RlpA family protein [Aurantiacibacter xanthus]|uniref:Endolytic peptidoglycan transglycosylase RlpA n=2 Tax=Aurantiacibacter xanthus TaxID=1784712 RepID=A0A3A1P6X4_9SPHN|nr:septal ring lytic transglycosylase RlpA family protein [Aurantiacibacter xanthus]
MVGAGHAETQLEAAALVAPRAATGPVFAPSEEARFVEAFAPYTDPAAPLDQTGPANAATITPAEPEATPLGSGNASYYGRRFNGRRTASGEAFDMTALTAAHRSLPFGTRVRVTYPRTGRSVIVRINDRGPYSHDRLIDLSRAAAEEIGLIAQGHGTVELAVLDS